MVVSVNEQDALIVVDMQKDFLPGGSLPVPQADRLLPLINRLLPCFSTRVLTRDWHPKDHLSFSDAPTFQDGSWPAHCVKNTPGAEFHPKLKTELADRVVSKADRRDLEAYSGFQGSDLADWLKARKIKRVFVTGVATEYCVRHTALDAKRAGFTAFLILDAIRGIDQPKGSVDQALKALKAAGIKAITSRELNGA